MPVAYVVSQRDVQRLVYFEIIEGLLFGQPNTLDHLTVNAIVFATDLSSFQDKNLQAICKRLSEEVKNFDSYVLYDASAIYDNHPTFDLAATMRVITRGSRLNVETGKEDGFYTINNANPRAEADFIIRNYDLFANAVNLIARNSGLFVHVTPRLQALAHWQSVHNERHVESELVERDIVKNHRSGLTALFVGSFKWIYEKIFCRKR